MNGAHTPVLKAPEAADQTRGFALRSAVASPNRKYRSTVREGKNIEETGILIERSRKIRNARDNTFETFERVATYTFESRIVARTPPSLSPSMSPQANGINTAAAKREAAER